MSQSSLHGVRVVVTRPLQEGRADRLLTHLLKVGAIPLHLPLIQILPMEDLTLLRDAVRRIRDFRWIVLTSSRAVAPLVWAMKIEGVDPSSLVQMEVRVCAVGPTTADALQAVGIHVDLLPLRFDAEGVVEVLRKDGMVERGSRVLFPRAKDGRDVIPQELSSEGVQVEVIPVYRTIPLREEADRLVGLVREGRVDVLTFTSGSAVRSFASAWSERPSIGDSTHRGGMSLSGVEMVSLGPSSTSALVLAGFDVGAEATEYTLDGLMGALEEWAMIRRASSSSD